MTRSKLSKVQQVVKYVGDGFRNVVAGLGTSRDKAAWSYYERSAATTRYELENIYRSSWLGKRIVNAVADDMVRGWRDWQFSENDEAYQFAATRAEKALGVREKVGEALRWSRLYGGAIIIMGIDGQDLATPLDVRTVKRGALRWLAVKDRWWLSYGGTPATASGAPGAPNISGSLYPTDGIRTLDLASPNYGKPEVYVVAESGLRVHWTRTLRFDGEMLPYTLFLQNQMWGDSVLQHTMRSLLNNDSTSAAIASLLFESNVDVITVENLHDLLTQEDGEKRVVQRFQAAATLKGNNRLLLLDGREKYEKKGAHFENLDKIWTQFQMDVSGAADIPIMRLFGQSAAGLNASGDNDIRNYYDAVRVRCERDLRPQLERLDEVMLRSALGAFPDDYRFEFGSLWQVSDTEKAVLQKERAMRDQIYMSAGVVSEGLVARELRETATYSAMTDEDVDAAEELASALDLPGELGAPALPEMGQETAKGEAMPEGSKGAEAEAGEAPHPNPSPSDSPATSTAPNASPPDTVRPAPSAPSAKPSKPDETD